MCSRSLLLPLLFAIASCGGKRKPAEEPASPPPPPAVDNRLDDDEPLPPPDEVPPPGGPLIATGSAECDQFLRVFEELLVRCEVQLGAAKDAMRQAVDAQRASFAAFRTLPPEDYAAAIEASRSGCQAAAEALRMSADSMNCGP